MTTAIHRQKLNILFITVFFFIARNEVIVFSGCCRSRPREQTAAPQTAVLSSVGPSTHRRVTRGPTAPRPWRGRSQRLAVQPLNATRTVKPEPLTIKINPSYSVVTGEGTSH